MAALAVPGRRIAAAILRRRDLPCFYRINAPRGQAAARVRFPFHPKRSMCFQTSPSRLRLLHETSKRRNGGVRVSAYRFFLFSKLISWLKRCREGQDPTC